MNQCSGDTLAILEDAVNIAQMYGSHTVESTHVLLALCLSEHHGIRLILESNGVYPHECELAFERINGKPEPRHPSAGNVSPVRGNTFMHLLEQAESHRVNDGAPMLMPEHLLEAIASTPGEPAYMMLVRLGFKDGAEFLNALRTVKRQQLTSVRR